jgi:hypothetical protein
VLLFFISMVIGPLLKKPAAVPVEA